MDYKEKVIALLNSQELSKEQKEKLENIFPELKESEDERIRKDLLGYLHTLPNHFSHNGSLVTEWAAWLEKQEQKSTWSEEDKNMLKWVTGYLNNKMLNTSISEERTACKNAIVWLEKQGNLMGALQEANKKIGELVEENYYLKEQGEQKPNPCNGCINRKGCINCENGELREVEQKPIDKVEPKFKVKYADSEYNVLEVKEIAGVTYYGIEDEPNHIDYVLPDNCEIVSEQKPADIQSIEKRAYEVFPDDNDENTPFYRQAFIDGAIDYIDCGCKKSSAWSEEDDYNLQCCIAKVQNDIDNGRIGRNRELLTWLKSLKDRVQPQPVKWSEDDENRFRNLIYLVEHSDEGKGTKEGFIKFINRLKSFNPSKQE